MAALQDMEAWLRRHEGKPLLRFLTCGSVDDGKSTLIGRLLYDGQLLPDDQLAAARAESRLAEAPEGVDFSLLLDGLAAEREQGITIDVAWRYFATARRRFIVADTPGHEQYTRNMVTGASTADAAVLLVDVRQGFTPQTRRHLHLVALLGIRHVAVAVNKMDLAGWEQAAFRGVLEEAGGFGRQLGLPGVTGIPVSALRGDNVAAASAHMPWHAGPTLLEWLETVELDADRQQRAPLRLPVQWINRRPAQDFRGYAGMLAGGCVRPGDRVRVLPSGREATVQRIVTLDGDLPQAVAGQSVTVTLAEAVDVARGDLIVAADAPAGVAHQFEATVVWLAEAPLLPGRSYLVKIGTRTVGGSVTEIKHEVQVGTLERLAARTLGLNAIGVCALHLDEPVGFDPYAENRETGAFLLIERASQATVGAGMIAFALRRSQNIQPQAVDVDKAARSRLNGQQPCVVWFTGLSGAGKSTIANLVEKKLHARGHRTYLLDGDNVRHGLNKDLGFTDRDRVENVRRVAEVARLMVDAGLIVLAAFISPFRAERALARSLLAPGEFVEVHVDVPLAVAERRDPKGLYRKARRGELRNFTGIDSRYEPPEQPELRLDTDASSAEEAADRVVALLEASGRLRAGS